MLRRRQRRDDCVKVLWQPTGLTVTCYMCKIIACKPICTKTCNYTIAPYYWVIKLRRHVHRKPCNFRTKSHTSVRASIRERSGWLSRRTGLNTSRIAARSPSPLPKKEHHIASGLGNHASERCCAQPLALPLPQSCLQYTDVTRELLAHCSLASAVTARAMLQWDLCMQNENGQVLVIQRRKLKNVQSCNFSVVVVCML